MGCGKNLKETLRERFFPGRVAHSLYLELLELTEMSGFPEEGGHFEEAFNHINNMARVEATLARGDLLDRNLIKKARIFLRE